MTISKNNYKDVVVGLGEIGKPILRLLTKATSVIGYDTNTRLMSKKWLKNNDKTKTRFLHICIPYTKKFPYETINLFSKYKPKGIVIHSTIGPGTTKLVQKKLPIPIIYSPTRGIHKRMIKDLKRYTKFYAIEKDAPKAHWASEEYPKLMKKCGTKVKKMSNTITLELAKIVVDTSYYGWLINYAQISNMIAKKHNVNYDEMWSYAEEIHEFLGNRPKMFPGSIGGHCLIPNLDLINDNTLNIIKEINSDYAKVLEKRRKQGKKY